MVARADAICAEANTQFEGHGVRGLTNAGIAAEMTATHAVVEGVVAQLEALEVDDASADDWEAYLDLYRKVPELDEKVIDAAEAGDDDTVNATFDALGESFDARRAAAAKIGLEVCSNDPAISIEPTGTGPAQGLANFEPGNTIEQAAEGWVKAVTTGDCDAINGQLHADATKFDDATCKALAGVDKITVEGTEQYGPVGIAEAILNGNHTPTMFVADVDGSGELRYGGDAIHDSGGLRPAPEGNDADEVAAAVVAAIADGDAEAFNGLIADPENSAFKVEADGFDSFGEGRFAREFVNDLRAGEPKAEPLGINATWAFYLVEGRKHDWVLNLLHVPGDGGEYRLSGYFPVPKPR